MARMTLQPSAINLTSGLALGVIGGVVAVFGGIMLWVGLLLALIGAYQVIVGVYRLATAIDVMAARTVRKAPEPANK